MDEKQVAAKMYNLGYRYIIFIPYGSDLDPLYAKCPMDIGPIVRTLIPSGHCNVQSIDDYLA